MNRYFSSRSCSCIPTSSHLSIQVTSSYEWTSPPCNDLVRFIAFKNFDAVSINIKSYFFCFLYDCTALPAAALSLQASKVSLPTLCYFETPLTRSTSTPSSLDSSLAPSNRLFSSSDIPTLADEDFGRSTSVIAIWQHRNLGIKLTLSLG